MIFALNRTKSPDVHADFETRVECALAEPLLTNEWVLHICLILAIYLGFTDILGIFGS